MGKRPMQPAKSACLVVRQNAPGKICWIALSDLALWKRQELFFQRYWGSFCAIDCECCLSFVNDLFFNVLQMT
jgi:hypothetical protein